MNRADKEKWPEQFEPEPRPSRSNSRRSSLTSTSRRNSLKKDNLEKTKKCQKNTSASSSANTTPKKSQKLASPHTPKKQTQAQNLDFTVTGRQILRKIDRANSLPCHQKKTDPGHQGRVRKHAEFKRNDSNSSKSRETSLEDDMSLDLSQVSDFEDNTSKYGIPKRMVTSTPKQAPKVFQKPRSGSLQSCSKPRILEETFHKSFDSRCGSNFTCSRDSLYKTSSTASYGRCTGRSTDLDYSSVSPEYSGQSSADLSPRISVVHSDVAVVSPYSQRSQLSGSSCYLSWVETSETDKTKTDKKHNETGEWNNFWANYNNSISRVPMKNYYDQCPTPYRTENIDFADLDLTEREAKTPDLANINNIIRKEGLNLTPRETQNIIKCAHILGNVLSKAIDRKANNHTIHIANKDSINDTTEDAKEVKKKELKLELIDQNKPLQVQVELNKESATTQTDISLPNTKSAPKIFESILRQLSKSSIVDKDEEDKTVAEQHNELVKDQ